jgi:hypothetical protein
MEQPEPPDTAALDRLAEDWIALWQSELASLAADPELASGWAALLGAFAGKAAAHDPAPGAAPAADASQPGRAARDAGAGGDAEARLLARIDALEQRLAALEQGPAGSGTDRRGARRRRDPA